MSRLDILLISLIVLLAGSGIYGVLYVVGVSTDQAQLWTTGLLGLALLGWIFSYLGRVLTGTMALGQQNQAYEISALQDRLETLSPDELEALEAEVEAGQPDLDP